MKYYTCKEASKLLDITARRIQQMCKDDEIAGAVKQGRSWMVPEDAVANLKGSSVHNEKNKPLPIGISDFKLVTEDYCYVDKTLMMLC